MEGIIGMDMPLASLYMLSLGKKNRDGSSSSSLYARPSLIMNFSPSTATIFADSSSALNVGVCSETKVSVAAGCSGDGDVRVSGFATLSVAWLLSKITSLSCHRIFVFISRFVHGLVCMYVSLTDVDVQRLQSNKNFSI